MQNAFEGLLFFKNNIRFPKHKLSYNFILKKNRICTRKNLDEIK